MEEERFDEKAELSKEDHIELINHCNLKEINFLSSVFSVEFMQC